MKTLFELAFDSSQTDASEIGFCAESRTSPVIVLPLTGDTDAGCADAHGIAQAITSVAISLDESFIKEWTFTP